MSIEIKNMQTLIGNIDDIKENGYNFQTESLEEKVKLLVIRDLLRLNWIMRTERDKIMILPPKDYDKTIIRQSMAIKRNEIISNNQLWIEKHMELAKKNLANGEDVLKSKIVPKIEVCEKQSQHDIFRIFRYYWSSPYSEYVGRRLKLIIRDDALPNKPVIGIAALGSPIVHIPERDEWIGWDRKKRTKNLIYTMDAYVIGALPPYNYLLGGKLLSYIIASNEVRKIYKEKYKDVITQIDKRTANDLVCIFTTSLYGRSSQYNRLKYGNDDLYIQVGETKGYGTLHLTEETFSAMQELLRAKNICVASKFGDGPCWRMRVIRTVGDLLGYDSDFLLQHSFKRSIYVVPLAKNYKKFLNGENKRVYYDNLPLRKLVGYWKERWLLHRIKYLEETKKIGDVKSFKRDNFTIL